MKVTKVQHPDDMTPEDIAEALASIPMLEHWIRSLKAHAFDVIKQGGKIPGWKLGYGVRKRVWVEGSQQALLDDLLELGIQRDDVFTKPELISPPKLEEHLKFLKLWPAKPRGGDRPPSVIDKYVTKSMPEPSLVRESEEDEPEMRRQEASEEFKKPAKK